MRQTGSTSRLRLRKLQTRDRILREAAKLFDERGFAATTVDQIVARADVSKGTFFNYFARKDDLLHSVLERRAAAAEASAAEILSLAIPVRDQLLALFAEAAHAWEEDREGSRHVLGALETSTLGRAAPRRPWRDMIQLCIERGQRSGEFRAGVDPLRVEALLGAVYHDTLSRWGARSDFELQHELREQLLLVLDGLAEQPIA